MTEHEFGGYGGGTARYGDRDGRRAPRLKTKIYTGKKDVERQKMNVFRMRLMGAEVNEVERGGVGLADAVDGVVRTPCRRSDCPSDMV